MQRWKCAVGAIVLIAVAGGSVAGCSKGANAKQNAAQAKAKPKADPKAAAAKTDPKAAKPAQTPANTAKTTAAAPKTTAPAQTAANAKTNGAQPAAAATKPATPAAAPKPAQTAATPKTSTPAAAAPNQPSEKAKPVAASVPVPAKPSPLSPAPAAPAPATAAAASGDVQQSLQANKTLTAQLQSRLPAGTDVVKASVGFRNLTQFVSAVHACQNLSIPLDKMRTAMVDEKKSLSAAIRALKPTASATIEAQRADYDARAMIYQAQHAETPADPAAKKTKPATAPGGDR